MSQTETHIGKLKKVETGGDTEGWCKSKLESEGKTELPSYHDTWIEYLKDEKYQRYFSVDEDLYEVIEHNELEEGNDIDILTPNEDGTISFIQQFYNGGTCLTECIEDGIKRLKLK